MSLVFKAEVLYADFGRAIYRCSIVCGLVNKLILWRLGTNPFEWSLTPLCGGHEDWGANSETGRDQPVVFLNKEYGMNPLMFQSPKKTLDAFFDKPQMLLKKADRRGRAFSQWLTVFWERMNRQALALRAALQVKLHPHPHPHPVTVHHHRHRR